MQHRSIDVKYLQKENFNVFVKYINFWNICMEALFIMPSIERLFVTIQKSLWFYNSFLKNNNKNIQQTYIHCLWTLKITSSSSHPIFLWLHSSNRLIEHFRSIFENVHASRKILITNHQVIRQRGSEMSLQQ